MKIFRNLSRQIADAMLIIALAPGFLLLPTFDSAAGERHLSNYQSFAAAISTVGSSDATLIVDTIGIVDNDMSIPATLHLVVRKQGKLAIGPGKTLIINGPFDAGPYQVFSGPGNVLFGGGLAREILPDWWKANAIPGKTNMQPAIQAALNSLGGNGIIPTGSTVMLEQQLYAIENSITHPKTIIGHNHSWVLSGRGPASRIINKAPANMPTIHIYEPFTGKEPYYFRIKNLTILGSAPYPNSGIYIKHAHNWHIENVKLFTNGPGIVVEGCVFPTMNNVEFYPAGNNFEATYGSTSPDYLMQFIGDTTYPCNVVNVNDLKVSSVALPWANVKHIGFTGIGGQTINIQGTLEGKTDTTGLEMTATSGHYENVNLEFHMEGPGVKSGYAIRGDAVRQGRVRIWHSSSTGASIKFSNSMLVTVEKSLIPVVIFDKTNTLCGVRDSYIINTYTNDSKSPITLQSTTGVAMLRNQYGKTSYLVQPYSSRLFTTQGIGEWMVEAVDMNTYTYEVIDGVVIVNFNIVASTVSGASVKELRITLPESIRSAANTYGIAVVSDNGATSKPSTMVAPANSTYIAIYNGMDAGVSWKASRNNTSVRGQLSIPIK